MGRVSVPAAPPRHVASTHPGPSFATAPESAPGPRAGPAAPASAPSQQTGSYKGKGTRPIKLRMSQYTQPALDIHLQLSPLLTANMWTAAGNRRKGDPVVRKRGMRAGGRGAEEGPGCELFLYK